MKKKGIWGFPEEQQPGGQAGALQLYAEFPRNQQAETLQVVRVQKSPWFIIIWEKLTDKVPRPKRVNIWCCYSRTIVFYKKPWTEDGKGEFQRWLMIDHVLRCDDVVEFEGERFEVGTGQVQWHQGAWYICMWARRKQKEL
ncbi:hypothetical protein GO755_29720 [Spirosoma sp. HMF4905]|uniref:Uncharacterized protein n=1 Tax=Spirosoma arboris TaxID=2682092 RepID=A0A7K1SKZ3_9BACT|nr:hypothetical protein [Spirosoma arboris]MVM34246.1 hypothetical protein [Spirosoma arboris]